MALTVLLALALQAAGAGQTVPPAPATAQAAPRPAALALARILNSEASIVGPAEPSDKATAFMEELSAGRADMKALEREHPGITRAIADAMIPIAVRSMRERLPELWRRQTLTYGARFDDAELETLTAFYGSPTGQKIIDQTQKAMGHKAMLAEAAASPDLKFGVDALQKDKAEAARTMAKALDVGDLMVVAMLQKTGLVDRIKAMGPRIQANILEWYDEQTPWEEAETKKAMAEVMTRFGVSGE